VTVRLIQLPGPPGIATSATIEHMRQLVQAAVQRPEVRDVALGIIRHCDGRDYWCQARALKAWLGRHFRFRRDPWGVEWVTAPERQLAIIRARGLIYGDCDDAAVLGATLGRAAGFSGDFVLLSFEPRPDVWAHVFARLLVPGPRPGVLDLDVTRPAQLPSRPVKWAAVPFY
jgi:hypothetical protein